MTQGIFTSVAKGKFLEYLITLQRSLIKILNRKGPRMDSSKSKIIPEIIQKIVDWLSSCRSSW